MPRHAEFAGRGRRHMGDGTLERCRILNDNRSPMITAPSAKPVRTSLHARARIVAARPAHPPSGNRGTGARHFEHGVSTDLQEFVVADKGSEIQVRRSAAPAFSRSARSTGKCSDWIRLTALAGAGVIPSIRLQKLAASSCSSPWGRTRICSTRLAGNRLVSQHGIGFLDHQILSEALHGRALLDMWQTIAGLRRSQRREPSHNIARTIPASSCL